MQYKCEVCWNPIKEFDAIFEHDDNIYHKDCVELYPIKHVFYANGEFIGEVEEDDVQYAYELLEDMEEEDNV